MLLDTCFCDDQIRERKSGGKGPATAKLASFEEARIFISLFTLCELRAGAELSAHPKRELERIERILDYVSVLYPDSSFPVFCGEAEAYLRKNGTPIPVMDLLIGITAKAAGIPLVTRDCRHLQLIPGLVVIEY